MEFTDVTNYFTRSNFYLKYFGLFLEDFSELPTWYKIYWFIVEILIIGIFNVFLITNWILNSTSLEGFASAGYIIMTCIMGQVKLFILISNRKYVLNLVEQFGQEYFKPRNEEEWNIVRIEFNFAKRMRRTITVTSYLSIFSAIVSPVFSNKYNGMPIPAWYPTNITISPAHEIALIHQEFSIFLVGTGYCWVDIMFGSILIFAGMQCNILSSRIKNAVHASKSNQHMQSMMVDCVTHQWKLFEFLRTVDKIFGNLYFWQLFASAMTLCMDLFLISVTDPKTFEFFYLIVYLIAIALVLLVPCWFASEMTIKSENISIAAYDCEWMDASSTFKKELQFFIQMSQRPLKVYAGHFFEISVETFVKIIRSALSYFAVLTNLNN